MKDRNLFHGVDTVGNIFTSPKILPMVFTRIKTSILSLFYAFRYDIDKYR